MKGHVARKRFGQNFLVDHGIIGAIISAIDPKSDEIVVEIGPGLGAITEPLMARVDHLHVVVIDPRWLVSLERRRRTLHPASRRVDDGADERVQVVRRREGVFQWVQRHGERVPGDVDRQASGFALDRDFVGVRVAALTCDCYHSSTSAMIELSST